MRPSPVRLLVVAALVASGVVLTTGTAGAAGPAVATSVGLNAEASCDDADLDLGLVTGTVDTETGLATNLAGEVLNEFSQPSGLDDENGIFDGYGISASGDPGTVIGSYASIGVAPLTAASAAEWFVLYQCGPVGTNVVLYSCFGDLGTCPTTAIEGAEAMFAPSVDDTTPDPGQTITVSADCAYPLGGALLLDGDTSLGGDSTETVDGAFSIELTVPSTVAPGTELTVQVDCGVEGQAILTADLPIAVAGEVETTTSSTEATTTIVSFPPQCVCAPPAPPQPEPPDFTG
jgi:hypothetical protein